MAAILIETLQMPLPRLSVDACRLRWCVRTIRQSSSAKGLCCVDNVRCSALAAQTQDQLDHYYMGLALQQAAEAFRCEEVPIGALIVSESEVVSVAYNKTEQRGNPLCHAELMCIMSAAEQLQAWRLQDATLYCTIEPCPMCAGAILQARLKRLVYGAKQPRLGADGSWVSLFLQHQQEQKTWQLQPQTKQQQSNLVPQQGLSGQFRHRSAVTSAQMEPHLAQHLADVHTPERQQQQADQQQQQQQCYQDCIVPNGSHPFHPDIVVTSGVRAEECRAIMQLFFRKRREQQKTLKILRQQNQHTADPYDIKRPVSSALDALANPHCCS